MNYAMQTTCPSCHAVFRVKPDQLEAHAGKVRCGKCAYVFNAFETLVSPIETVSLMAPPADDFSDEFKDEAGTGKSGISEIPAHDVRPLTISEPMSATFPIPTDDQIEREAEAINREIAASAHPELIEEIEETDKTPKSGLHITPELHEKLNNLQLQLTTQEKHARWRGVVWGGGIAVLCLLLAGQSVYFLRNQVAAYYPDTKPLLSSLCHVLHCKVDLLANADLIKLESSELQSAPERPGGVTLNASLRNLAPYRQAYPSLELTLTDSANLALARRQFTPSDYLPQNIKPESGMPRQDELPIKLTLELVGLEAVGYKLLVFYP
ncbi:MAG: zinc-ribbon domain-containing protein [Hydrogenophilales bacterium]|nr:zinc-ribbon domain-containing protein [Hydrogenophilales bacterium]